jgi:hypothetical protein
MAGETSLIDREFIGTILSTKDTMHQGKYKVNVPELQPHMKSSEGIWCKNQTHKYRLSPTNRGVCGSYYPLQPGMSVIVKFFANHIESGYVDRIISDPEANTLPYELIERDDYYQIIRTPRYNNLICIYEGPPPPNEVWTKENSQRSKNIPRNSIHIYFNETRTVVVIDELGVHIITADNVDIKSAKVIKIEALGDININSGGNIKMQAVGDINIKSGKKINTEAIEDININSGAKINNQAIGDINIKSGAIVSSEAVGDVNIKSGGSIKNQATSNINIKAGGSNFIESSSNHLSGTNIGAVPAGSASPATAADAAGDAGTSVEPDPVVNPDLIAIENDYEYFKRSFGG